MRHCHWIMSLIPNAACTRFRVNFDDKIQIVMLSRPFAELQHFWKLVGRIDVQNWKRHAPEKRFACQPDENIGILSHRPWHGYVLEGVIRLAENENALVLEIIEMRATHLGHILR